MTTEYVIEGDVLQKVLDYLTTKPFAEVNALIVAVQNSAKPFDPPQTEWGGKTPVKTVKAKEAK